MSWTDCFALVYYGALLVATFGATLALASFTFGFLGIAIIRQGIPTRERVASFVLALGCLPAAATALWAGINLALPRFLEYL